MGKAWAHFRWFEAGIALSGVAAFAVVGPFRGAFATLPEILLVGTFVLFMVPGALLTRWFLGEHFSEAALLPAAFVISTGALALLGVTVLLLQSTLDTYLWISGIAVAASLLAAVLVALRPEQTERVETGPVGFDRGGLLWLPFLALVAALAYISRINAPSYFGDIWVYLSWVREFLGGGHLASRDPYCWSRRPSPGFRGLTPWTWCSRT